MQEASLERPTCDFQSSLKARGCRTEILLAELTRSSLGLVILLVLLMATYSHSHSLTLLTGISRMNLDQKLCWKRKEGPKRPCAYSLLTLNLGALMAALESAGALTQH